MSKRNRSSPKINLDTQDGCTSYPECSDCCESAWHQPDCNKYLNKKPAVIEENQLTASNHFLIPETSIHKLNEYCLLHIFSFLPVKDRIRIERVCRYWQMISAKSLQLPLRNFDSIFNYYNWPYIRDASTLHKILEKFGPLITKVNFMNGHKLGNATLIAIATSCPNIEEINLSDFPYLASGLNALAKNCTKIKHLIIGKSSYYKTTDYRKYDDELSYLFSTNCIEYLALEDNIISGSCLKYLSPKKITSLLLTNQDCSIFVYVISKIENLFTLKMCSCYNVSVLFTVKSLNLNAENIKILSITHDLDSQAKDISYFFKFSHLKNLKYLTLSDIHNMTDNILFSLGDNLNFQHQLTYLDISHNKNLTNKGIIWIISSLSNLEHFVMVGMTEITDEVFCCGMPNLKTLNCSFCQGIGDNGLIQFINNSEKLEKLNLQGCTLITNTLIFAALEYTQSKKNEIVLSINVYNTKVKINEIEENSPLLNFRDIFF